MFIESVVLAALWVLVVIIGTVALYRVSEFPARAPGIDIVLSLLSWVPWVFFAARGGWAGIFGCFVGQYIALQIFTIVHTKASGYRGPKIRTTLDRIVGPTRNHLGLLITVPALPVFLLIRVAEIFVYPWLVWVLKFPKYKQDEWVNVSRQKFGGLVGHDLVWCLYCDWMTGVYSLGAEMLRSVESFWCPIRFYEGKKCENCKLDFPDLKEWIPADGKMKEVTNLLEKKYSGEEKSWFGHPERKNKNEDSS